MGAIPCLRSSVYITVRLPETNPFFSVSVFSCLVSRDTMSSKKRAALGKRFVHWQKRKTDLRFVLRYKAACSASRHSALFIFIFLGSAGQNTVVVRARAGCCHSLWQPQCHLCGYVTLRVTVVELPCYRPSATMSIKTLSIRRNSNCRGDVHRASVHLRFYIRFSMARLFDSHCRALP